MSAAVPASFTDTLVATVDNPTSLAFAPNGRILVTTQFGALRVIANDVLLTQPALDLSAAVCTNAEQGLLGVDVDPAFSTNGFVYLYYTRNLGGTCLNRVSRFVMSGDVISPASETVLIDGIPSPDGQHNAGDLHFAKDGYLYVSVGDGSCDYDGGGCAGGNDASRDQHVLLGKILRITSTGAVPPTNPFLGAGTASCAATGRTTPGNKCRETYAWVCATRSGSRSTRTPPGHASSSTTPVRTSGKRSTWASPAPTTAGTCARGTAPTARTTDCGPPPAGMTNPISTHVHQSGVHGDHRRRLRAERVWPAAYDGTYLYARLHLRQDLPAHPDGGGGFTRTEFATNASVRS